MVKGALRYAGERGTEFVVHARATIITRASGRYNACGVAMTLEESPFPECAGATPGFAL